VVVVIVVVLIVKLPSFNFLRHSGQFRSAITAVRNTFFSICFLVSVYTLSLWHWSLSPYSIQCPCDTRYCHIRDFLNTCLYTSVSTITLLTLLLLLSHCNLCYSLQQFSRFLVLFVSSLPQALHTVSPIDIQFLVHSSHAFYFSTF